MWLFHLGGFFCHRLLADRRLRQVAEDLERWVLLACGVQLVAGGVFGPQEEAEARKTRSEKMQEAARREAEEEARRAKMAELEQSVARLQAEAAAAADRRSPI